MSGNRHVGSNPTLSATHHQEPPVNKAENRRVWAFTPIFTTFPAWTSSATGRRPRSPRTRGHRGVTVRRSRYGHAAGPARRAVGVRRNPCRLTSSACGASAFFAARRASWLRPLQLVRALPGCAGLRVDRPVVGPLYRHDRTITPRTRGPADPRNPADTRGPADADNAGSSAVRPARPRAGATGEPSPGTRLPGLPIRRWLPREVRVRAAGPRTRDNLPPRQRRPLPRCASARCSRMRTRRAPLPATCSGGL